MGAKEGNGMRLLLAEDERELADALCAILRHQHYSVDAVYNGDDALDYGLAENYDGIILDIMMPGKNGIEVLRTLRARGIVTPVLLLTAKSEVEDRVLGLDAGADDYLPKPFDTRELLARLRAMTRRPADFTPNLLEAGNLQLNRETFTISGEKGSLRLGSKEFQMLEMLMRNPKRLISAEQFMDRIWGYDADAESSVVWVYISYLRKKLAAVGANVEIKATRGVGYSLEGCE